MQAPNRQKVSDTEASNRQLSNTLKVSDIQGPNRWATDKHKASDIQDPKQISDKQKVSEIQVQQDKIQYT